MIDPDFPFMVPSMRCQPLIDCATLRFHSELYDNANYFGILSINMRGEVLATNKKQYFIFSIDCSGSMSDKCNDSRTKMQHILHTVVNIIKIFANTYENQITITVNAFDDTVKNIINNTVVTKENVESLLNKITTSIYPMGLTNIADSLQSASNIVSNINQLEYDVTHILLTDGDITSGVSNADEMSIPQCKNVYIGYGSDHDAYLLANLASKNCSDEYKFIDVLEKAGFVYGELLQNILYKSYDKVTIDIDNGEIYDYNKNAWTKRLFVGDLVSEQKKIYHVRSTQPHASLVHISGRKLHKTRMFEVLPENPELIYEVKFVTLSNASPIDLTQYIYRQKAQELLYEARQEQHKIRSLDVSDTLGIWNRHHKLESHPIKNKLKELFDTIRKYMVEKEQEDNKLLKSICDDLYIAYETYGREDGFMFTVARQTSQGRQETYSCNRIETVDLMYQLSDNIDTPYLTQGVLTMMREVSYNKDESQDEEQNEDRETPVNTLFKF